MNVFILTGFLSGILGIIILSWSVWFGLSEIIVGIGFIIRGILKK